MAEGCWLGANWDSIGVAHENLSADPMGHRTGTRHSATSRRQGYVVADAGEEETFMNGLFMLVIVVSIILLIVAISSDQDE